MVNASLKLAVSINAAANQGNSNWSNVIIRVGVLKIGVSEFMTDHKYSIGLLLAALSGLGLLGPDRLRQLNEMWSYKNNKFKKPAGPGTDPFSIIRAAVDAKCSRSVHDRYGELNVIANLLNDTYRDS